MELLSWYISHISLYADRVHTNCRWKYDSNTKETKNPWKQQSRSRLFLSIMMKQSIHLYVIQYTLCIRWLQKKQSYGVEKANSCKQRGSTRQEYENVQLKYFLCEWDRFLLNENVSKNAYLSIDTNIHSSFITPTHLTFAAYILARLESRKNFTWIQ